MHHHGCRCSLWGNTICCERATTRVGLFHTFNAAGTLEGADTRRICTAELRGFYPHEDATESFISGQLNKLVSCQNCALPNTAGIPLAAKERAKMLSRTAMLCRCGGTCKSGLRTCHAGSRGTHPWHSENGHLRGSSGRSDSGRCVDRAGFRELFQHHRGESQGARHVHARGEDGRGRGGPSKGGHRHSITVRQGWAVSELLQCSQ
jgi:hypothetical protein